jgi:hypothetical protein
MLYKLAGWSCSRNAHTCQAFAQHQNFLQSISDSPWLLQKVCSTPKAESHARSEAVKRQPARCYHRGRVGKKDNVCKAT